MEEEHTNRRHWDGVLDWRIFNNSEIQYTPTFSMTVEDLDAASYDPKLLCTPIIGRQKGRVRRRGQVTMSHSRVFATHFVIKVLSLWNEGNGWYGGMGRHVQQR